MSIGSYRVLSLVGCVSCRALSRRPQKLELISVTLNNLVEEALTTVSDQTGLGGDKFNRKIVTGCRVKGDADKLKQVLINVLTNACEAGGSEPVLLNVHPVIVL